MKPPGPTSRPAVPQKQPASKPPVVLRSTDLFDGTNEVLIEHQSQLYRLRVTSLGKLILTK